MNCHIYLNSSFFYALLNCPQDLVTVAFLVASSDYFQLLAYTQNVLTVTCFCQQKASSANLFPYRSCFSHFHNILIMPSLWLQLFLESLKDISNSKEKIKEKQYFVFYDFPIIVPELSNIPNLIY